MGQRSKAMDTESPTSKFLYAIIKQMDLKIIDWNTVAREMSISNGHAARMRYSRFKSQIDPSTAQRSVKKKIAKKGEKGKYKGDFSMQKNMELPMNRPSQMPFPWVSSGPTVKAEPTERFYQHNPMLKSEPGHDNIFGDRALLAPSDSMMPLAYFPGSREHQYMSHEFPFSMHPGGAEAMQMSSSSPFATYPTMTLPQVFNLQDFTMPQQTFNNVPMITWERPAPSQRESTPVTSEVSTPALVKEEPKDEHQTVELETPIKTEQDSANDCTPRDS